MVEAGVLPAQAGLQLLSVSLPLPAVVNLIRPLSVQIGDLIPHCTEYLLLLNGPFFGQE